MYLYGENTINGMNNNHQTEEGRNKIRLRQWVAESVRQGDPLPFPCLSPDSSLGLEPAFRSDGLAWMLLSDFKNLLAWQK